MKQFSLSMVIFLVLNCQMFAQKNDVTSTSNTVSLLTSDNWNIVYNIKKDGQKIEEEDPEKIKSNWVRFYADGTFETPAGMSGKTKGKWTLDSETDVISFQENGAKYAAKIETISELELVLNYINNGGFMIGMVHYIYVPSKKTNEEISAQITSGKWLVVSKNFEDNLIKTPNSEQKETWFEFNENGTYEKSGFENGQAEKSSGIWFLDKEKQLNLDDSESSIYTVIGDQKKMIWTTITNGYNTIELKKQP